MRSDFFEADLIADLVAETAATFEGDAFGEEPRGKPARLEDDDFAGAEEATIEQDLRHLGGFSGAGRRLQDQAGPNRERLDYLVFEFVYREIAQIHASDRNMAAPGTSECSGLGMPWTRSSACLREVRDEFLNLRFGRGPGTHQPVDAGLEEVLKMPAHSVHPLHDLVR